MDESCICSEVIHFTEATDGASCSAGICQRPPLPFHFCFVYFACREPLPLPALSAECASPASDASSFLSLSAPHFGPYNFPAACVLGTFCGEFQIISGRSAVATSVCMSVASHPLWPCVQVNSSHSGWAQTDCVHGVYAACRYNMKTNLLPSPACPVCPCEYVLSASVSVANCLISLVGVVFLHSELLASVPSSPPPSPLQHQRHESL